MLCCERAGGTVAGSRVRQEREVAASAGAVPQQRSANASIKLPWPMLSEGRRYATDASGAGETTMFVPPQLHSCLDPFERRQYQRISAASEHASDEADGIVRGSKPLRQAGARQPLVELREHAVHDSDLQTTLQQQRLRALVKHPRSFAPHVPPSPPSTVPVNLLPCDELADGVGGGDRARASYASRAELCPHEAMRQRPARRSQPGSLVLQISSRGEPSDDCSRGLGQRRAIRRRHASSSARFDQSRRHSRATALDTKPSRRRHFLRGLRYLHPADMLLAARCSETHTHARYRSAASADGLQLSVQTVSCETPPASWSSNPPRLRNV